jgi:peptide/nickel transport system permease protein
MVLFLLKRCLRAVAAMLICLTTVFILLRVAGDPAAILLPPETPPAVRAEYREMWGLDRALPEQFALYLWSTVRGDFGISLADDQPVVAILLEALPRTLLLGASALAIAAAVGLPLGLMAALRHNTPIDRFVMSVAVMGYSMPVFFLGILLIFLFALNLRILPSAGSSSAWHLIMPALTLGLPLAGRLARFARTSALEVLGRPFIRTARAKGVSSLGVVIKHALPNAAVPMLMFLGIEIGHILAGAAVTETIFAWPGLGRLLVESVAHRDLPVAQGVILLVTLIMVLSNLAVDLVHAALDPRIGSSEMAAGRS